MSLAATGQLNMSQKLTICDMSNQEALRKVASEGQARRNQVKKRNLQMEK